MQEPGGERQALSPPEVRQGHRPDFLACGMDVVIESPTPERSRAGKNLESRFWPDSLVLKGERQRGELLAKVTQSRGLVESGLNSVCL